MAAALAMLAPEITFEEVVTELVNELAGCPDWIIARAYRNAASEFYQETGSYREENIVTPDTGIVEYELELQEGFSVLRLVSVIDSTDRYYTIETPSRLKTRGSSVPMSCALFDNTLVFNQTPEYECSVWFEVVPGAAAASLYYDKWNKDYRALQYGALSHIQSMPNKAWSDPRAGALNRQRFEEMMYQHRRSRVKTNRVARFNW